MPTIPKKAIERFIKEVPRFQTILKSAKDRDINEADTVTIISDILASVFGFDKYTEITCEYAIRSQYCDLAVKVDGKPKYLLEAKAVGIELKINHLQQALNYGANHGIQWIVLTNGIAWEVHCIKFDKPISADLVYRFDFLTLNARKKEDQDKLFMLCKEGLSKSAIEDYHERAQTINRFTIAALLTTESAIDTIRRELRKLVQGLQVDNTEIEAILKNEVLKREVIEGDAAAKARARVKRGAQKPAPKPAKIGQPTVVPQTMPNPVEPNKE